MTIGDRIKQRRLELGLSADDLGKRINKNRATIYRYESNDIENLPTTVIPLLAKALETTPAYIMGWMRDEKIGDAFHNNMNDINVYEDSDLAIIQRERSKMSNKERTKLMNILKANFDEYNWEEDDSGNID